MQNGGGEGGEKLDMAELSRAVMASETEPTVVDFAPPNNPQRIQRVVELMGTSIRRTCAVASRVVIELVDQADAVVRQLRDDANAFVQLQAEIGNAHAAHIERASTHLRGLVETIGAERHRMAVLADTHHIRGGEKSHRPIDGRENVPASKRTCARTDGRLHDQKIEPSWPPSITKLTAYLLPAPRGSA